MSGDKSDIRDRLGGVATLLAFSKDGTDLGITSWQTVIQHYAIASDRSGNKSFQPPLTQPIRARTASNVDPYQIATQWM
jgi:hypothetical protein